MNGIARARGKGFQMFARNPRKIFLASGDVAKLKKFGPERIAIVAGIFEVAQLDEGRGEPVSGAAIETDGCSQI